MFIYIYMYTHPHIHIHVCNNIYVYTHIHIRMYTGIYMELHMYLARASSDNVDAPLLKKLKQTAAALKCEPRGVEEACGSWA